MADIVTVTFTYTKSDGNVSDRNILVLKEAKSNLMGIDLQKLVDKAKEAHFIEKYKELKNRQYQELLTLMSEFDLDNQFRQFKPEGITNMTNIKR